MSLAPFLLLLLPLLPAAAQEPVRVYAAASLTDVLEAASRHYGATTGNPEPERVFGATSQLARQIQQGAPADLVITADERWMGVLVEEGLVIAATAAPLVENRLVVVQPQGEAPLPNLSALAQLAHVALAAPEVPAGRYAREALHSAGVLLGPDQLVLTADVRGALGAVGAGAADAALVYATDARVDPRVQATVSVDPALHGPVVVALGLSPAGQARPEARAFAAYLRGPEAARIFRDAGFVPRTEIAQSAAAPTIALPPPPDDDLQAPILRSLWVASMALLVSVVPATLLGWLMARRSFAGKSLLSLVLLAPLVLPPVVTGWLLLQLLSPRGPLAPALDLLGLHLAFSRWGAVIAATVVGFPLFIVLARQAIEQVDPRLASLAETLGCTPFAEFLKITLPMALPGIAAGATLAFARALGEFGATAMLAGDIPGETRTMALAVYALSSRPGGEDAAATLVWISLGLSLAALAGYEALSRRQRALIEDRP